MLFKLGKYLLNILFILNRVVRIDQDVVNISVVEDVKTIANNIINVLLEGIQAVIKAKRQDLVLKLAVMYAKGSQQNTVQCNIDLIEGLFNIKFYKDFSFKYTRKYFLNQEQ